MNCNVIMDVIIEFFCSSFNLVINEEKVKT